MPALMPGSASDGSGDRLGMKWLSGNPANNAVGFAGMFGLLALNDPVTTVEGPGPPWMAPTVP